jgi:DNA-binding response OmpR family regulator
VEIVRDGDSACSRALEAAFDLILLDIMLPRKDGFDVCRDLRRARVRTPILMLTAKTQEAEKIMGLELGADDYVTKPYSPRELRARIKALLRRAADDLPQVYRFGDVEVDFARYEVRRGGRLIEVTPTEFKLLAAFVRHPGRVLTRDQLLDQVWGHGVFVTDRVVDNQITNLRKKIEPKPSQPRYVINVRGVGYRFDG